MKYILTLCFLIGVAYAQEPAYTPMRLSYQFRGIKVDSLFLIPSFSDTTSANSSTMKNVAGAMIRTGNDFWMRNAATTSWLQNVNVGSGASTSVQFVDSVWRVVGKDSIFWRKGGVTSKIKDSIARAVDTIYRTVGKDSIFFKIGGTTYKIKDSTGGGGTDSPDRIDGTATGGVTADMDGKAIRFADADVFIVSNSNSTEIQAIDSIKLSSPDVYLDGALRQRASYGQNSYYKDTVNNIQGAFKITYGENGINLASGDYTMYLPGVYELTGVGGGNTLYLPDVSSWPGQSWTIVNRSGSNLSAPYFSSLTGAIEEGATGNSIANILTDQMLVCYSDGNRYYCIIY